MNRKIIGIFFIFSLLIVSGCASIRHGYEKPVVTITSFKAIPTGNLIPQFEIGLRIVNPNRLPLKLKGISYTIAIEGHKIMTGVSNQLPSIEAYGEDNVVLKASVGLFSSISFITNLIGSKKKDKISYSLEAKLDTGTLQPLIRITKKGELSLTQPMQNQ